MTRLTLKKASLTHTTVPADSLRHRIDGPEYNDFPPYITYLAMFAKEAHLRTLRMTDQLSRDIDVRDEISKQHNSAMDDRAKEYLSSYHYGHETTQDLLRESQMSKRILGMLGYMLWRYLRLPAERYV